MVLSKSGVAPAGRGNASPASSVPLGAAWHDLEPGPKKGRVATSTCEQRMDWNATALWPAIWPTLLLLVCTPPDQRDLSSIVALQSRAEEVLVILDEHLRENPFMAESGFTMADIPVSVSIHEWLNLAIDCADFPALQSWYSKLEKPPAFRD
jgi:glutathione S-transferase